MSKRILLFFLFLPLIFTSFAQGINFQGVARSANGTIIAGSNVGLRLSIVSKNIDATPEYIETKTVMTNAQGIFSVVVGDASNTTVVGNFKSIVWSEGPKFLKVEMDPTGGTSYLNMGATQLQYVPYSFYSYGVDGANIRGIVPVKSGGTGVTTLEELKTALNIIIPPSIDTTSLSNRLNLKLDKADTLNLSNRINTKFSYGDTISLSNRINGKLNISDTLNLSNRINSKLYLKDTLNLSNRIDALNEKVSIQSNLFTTKSYTRLNRDKLSNVLPGSIIWCTNCGTNGELQVFNGSFWQNLTGGSTSRSKPELDSVTISDITGHSVVAKSMVFYNDDINNFIQAGITLSKSPNPIFNGSNSISKYSSINSNSSTRRDSIVFSVNKFLNLDLNTKYYIRSYASNDVGSSYGPESIFYTNNITSVPENVYVWAQIITPNKAFLKVYVEDKGGVDLVESGIEYSFDKSFVNKTKIISSNNEDIILENLIPNQKYYLRAFAKNANGVAVSSSDTANFKSYDLSQELLKTEVQINGKTWSARNLNVFNYRNGDPIPLVTDSATWSNLTTGAYCYYKNDSITYGYLGKLYNWYAVNDSRGLAPIGWHINSTSEAQSLLDYFNFSQSRGGLSNVNGVFVNPGGTMPDNKFGFSSLPAGARQGFDDKLDFQIFNSQFSIYWNKDSNTNKSRFWIFPLFGFVDSSNTGILQKSGHFVRLVKD